MSRIRRGILRGPQLGDPGNEKKPVLVTVGIDGSVTLIQSSGLFLPFTFDRVKILLSHYSPACQMLLESILPPSAIELIIASQSSRDIDAFNLDMMSYLVRRVSLGMWTSLLSRTDAVLYGQTKRDKFAVLEMIRFLLDRKDLDMEGYDRVSV